MLQSYYFVKTVNLNRIYTAPHALTWHPTVLSYLYYLCQHFIKSSDEKSNKKIRYKQKKLGSGYKKTRILNILKNLVVYKKIDILDKSKNLGVDIQKLVYTYLLPDFLNKAENFGSLKGTFFSSKSAFR